MLDQRPLRLQTSAESSTLANLLKSGKATAPSKRVLLSRVSRSMPPFFCGLRTPFITGSKLGRPHRSAFGLLASAVQCLHFSWAPNLADGMVRNCNKINSFGILGFCSNTVQGAELGACNAHWRQRRPSPCFREGKIPKLLILLHHGRFSRANLLVAACCLLLAVRGSRFAVRGSRFAESLGLGDAWQAETCEGDANVRLNKAPCKVRAMRVEYRYGCKRDNAMSRQGCKQDNAMSRQGCKQDNAMSQQGCKRDNAMSRQSCKQDNMMPRQASQCSASRNETTRFPDWQANVERAQAKRSEHEESDDSTGYLSGHGRFDGMRRPANTLPGESPVGSTSRLPFHASAS